MPNFIKKQLIKNKLFEYYFEWKKYLKDPYSVKIRKLNKEENSKKPSRTEVINYLLSQFQGDTNYVEIGVRNPDDNFNKIKATNKYSVDPGVEYELNPVNFVMTSDAFFEKLSANEILNNNIKFDVMFIDGLHLAEQVDRDIENAFKYIKDDGFVVVHDCNPPSEWHAREYYQYLYTPAQGFWNGTSWKAFVKWRSNSLIYSCCINCDWGVGILSKNQKIGNSLKLQNPFFEYNVFNEKREKYLNLIDFDTLKKLLSNK